MGLRVVTAAGGRSDERRYLGFLGERSDEGCYLGGVFSLAMRGVASRRVAANARLQRRLW